MLPPPLPSLATLGVSIGPERCRTHSSALCISLLCDTDKTESEFELCSQQGTEGAWAHSSGQMYRKHIRRLSDLSGGGKEAVSGIER